MSAILSSPAMRPVLPLPRVRRGGGMGWGCFSKKARDHLDDRLGGAENLVIPEANDAKSLLSEKPRTLPIAPRLLGMLPAIDLDDELPLQTSEVNDIWADGALAAKAIARETPPPHVRPQTPLGVGHELAQRSCAFVCHGGFAEAPPPHPPPRLRAGEGADRTTCATSNLMIFVRNTGGCE